MVGKRTQRPAYTVNAIKILMGISEVSSATGSRVSAI